MENKEIKLELRNISKQFNGVYANKNVNICLYKGEILSILGENGSGKTTLMNVLSGIYTPDEGEIYINSTLANLHSPKDAFSYGIGMVHQHFNLVDVFTSLENIVLGLKEKVSMKEASEKVMAIANKYGFKIDLNKKIHNMSVSEKQTVEIIKVLYRNVDVLILDEPTAVLTPQEIETLFAVIRKMREDNKSIIIITHKLNEVLSISDRVSVLRKGEYIGTLITKDTNERELTNYMVGNKVDLNLERLKQNATAPVLEIRDLNIMKDDGTTAIKNLNFFLRGGQILGVAGIAGCGQKELCEAIVGLRKYKGIISHYGKSLAGISAEKIKEQGIRMSFIPEDRLGLGLAPDLSIVDNLLLKSYQKSKGIFVDRKSAREDAVNLIKRYNVQTESVETPVKNLSGGNIQKILLGREIGTDPNVIITAYPVRGLDINSSYMVYDILNEEKAKNTAILFIGEDLDVLLTFCDKIMVLCQGENMGIVHTKDTTKEEIGLMMTGARNLCKLYPEKNYGLAEDSQLKEEK
jgi:ABC-type uncharacterized transport system ATPase subunit